MEALLKTISIITINKDNAVGLERTIQSVISQNYNHIEYIVIDGGSKDGSQCVIERYANAITHSVCEPDEGIYDAQNKGASLATGEYLLFLNAGDTLCVPDVVERAFGLCQNEQLLFGSLVVEDAGGAVSQRDPFDDIRMQLIADSVWHPCTFIESRLFQSVGGYRKHEYGITADHEFFIRVIYRGKATSKKLPFPVSRFNLEGISSLQQSRKQIRAERYRAVRKNSTPELLWFFLTYELLRRIGLKKLWFMVFCKSGTLWAGGLITHPFPIDAKRGGR